MDNKTILIVAVAVIAVAIVAVAAIFLLGGNKDPSLPTDIDKGTGTVYGNADGNCYIDEEDVKVIEAIITRNTDSKTDNDVDWKNDFPFADANCDGNVDQNDVNMVNDIIAKKSVRINVLSTNDGIVSVNYPIKNFIVLSGSNLAPLMNILDVSDMVIAAAYSTLDPIRDYSIQKGIDDKKITKLSTAGTAADMDLISKLDTTLMITEYSSMYALDSDENVENLKKAYGIDTLRMECRDIGQDTRSMVVFGILFGKEKEAQSYIDFCNDVYDNIKKVEGDKFGSEKIMITSLATTFCGQTSGYTPMIEMAGGVNLADWSESSKRYNTGDTWIYETKYNSDTFFIGNASNYGGKGFTDAQLTAAKDNYDKTDVWKNGDVWMYSTGIPVVCRIAYYAECMYPELFEAGWAKGIHQKFVDDYFDTAFTVPDDQFCKKVN